MSISQLKIYNTLSRKKEVFKPRKAGKVNMFVCGPTVYDWPHIGHARTYIAFDMFVRFLRRTGYDVFYLQNITDISEKITDRARKINTRPAELAKKFEGIFYADMLALGIKSVTKYARATDYIPEIIKQVERLVARNFAYVVDGSVYFRINKFKPYGNLSRQQLTALKTQAKHLGDADIAEAFGKEQEKENPLDFALWKKSDSNEPQWKSPWGWGRPGWHIEDTVISEKFFGAQYDLHGGGIDLIFPHHECEIAQQESASGKKPFVRYWMHAGHLKISGTKMSKSLGNFITIRTMLETTRPEAIRLMVASTHYRSPLDYTDDLLKQTESAWQGLQEFVSKLEEKKSQNKKRFAGRIRQRAERGGDNVGTDSLVARAREDFDAALEDDFNTPRALASLFKLVAQLNPLVGSLKEKDRKNVQKFFKEVDAILGVIGRTKTEKVPVHIKALVDRREALRKEKRFEEADKVRGEIAKAGWTVQDSPSGPKLIKARS